MKFDRKNIYKYLFYILFCIFLLIILPIMIGLNNKKIFNFEIGEILNYYGVILSGAITMIALIITVNNADRARSEEFKFQIKQKYIQNIEEYIRRVCSDLIIKFDLVDKTASIPYLVIYESSDAQNFNISSILDNISNCANLLDELKVRSQLYKSEIRLYINIDFVSDDILEKYVKIFESELDRFWGMISEMRRKLFDLNMIVKKILELNRITYEQVKLFNGLKDNLNNDVGCILVYQVGDFKKFLDRMSEFLKLINEESVAYNSNKGEKLNEK